MTMQGCFINVVCSNKNISSNIYSTVGATNFLTNW